MDILLAGNTIFFNIVNPWKLKLLLFNVKDLTHTTAKLRASLVCDDLTDKKLDVERKKFIDYIKKTREQSAQQTWTVFDVWSVPKWNSIAYC